MNRELRIMNKESGFTLMELLLAIAIGAIIFTGMARVIVAGVDITERDRRMNEALFLAEEGIEAIRAMRDDGWSANIEPLQNDSDYYIVPSGNVWSITGTNPGLLLERYERTIRFNQVHRDAQSNISGSGTLDPDTKMVAVTVGWREGAATTTVVLETYITNFLDN